MPKILLILVIISLLLSPVFALRSQIWASEAPEIPKEGEDALQEIKGQDIVSTIKGIIKALRWIENTVKKIWSFLTKAYYWAKGKIYQPVSY